MFDFLRGHHNGEDYDFQKVSANLSKTTLTWTDTGRFSNTTYTYKIKAFDAVGNTSTSATESIIVDTENPGVTITQPAATSFIDTNSVQVIADYGNTFNVNCHAKQNDGSWIDMGGDNLQNGTASYTFTNLEDGEYVFTVECWDLAGNLGIDIAESVTVDTSAPVAFIEINNNKEDTVTDSVTLNLIYSAGVGTQCRYQNQGGSWTSWEACAATKAWTISGGLGTKTVNYEVKDGAGNVTAASDQILYRAQEPPVASNVTIKGIKLEGEILSSSYTYTDIDEDLEDTSSSVYVWYRADDASGTNQAVIAGATNQTYALTAGDAGKFIKFQVTPVSLTGTPNTGSAVSSSYLGPILGLSAKDDRSQDVATEITLDTSTAGSAKLGTDKAVIILDTDQKLEFQAALETTTASTQVNGTTIDAAIESVTGGSYNDANVESITLESGISGENIILASTDNIQVEIPDGTNVYSSPNWNGTIAPPVDITGQVTAPAYTTAERAIGIGTPGETLILDSPVKVLIPSSLGKPYYSQDGVNWTEITTQCADENGTGLVFPGECYYKTGDVTIVWTYHFTNYADIADTTAPIITSRTLATDNTYIDVDFSEAVYATTNGTGALLVSDFTLVFTQNGGNATGASITSITNTSGGVLVGGETTVRVHFTLAGIPVGLETVAIKPSSATALYDLAGNAMLATESTGNVIFYSAPKATSVNITGTPMVGQILTGNYTYTDKDGDLQGASIYRWLRSSAVDGVYSAINGATSKSYMLTNADKDKYIKFEVKPVAASGSPSVGTKVVSTAAGEITSSAPEAQNVRITGLAITDRELTGIYFYSDADGDAEGNTTYRWLKADGVEGPYSAIVGATNKTYTLTAVENGKYIKFEVTPIALGGDPATGVVTLSTAFGPITNSAAIEDYHLNQSITEIDLDTTTIGSAKLATGKTTFLLARNQKLKFTSALEQVTDTVNTEPVAGTSIKTAMENIMGIPNFTSNVERITLESGIEGEDITIASSDNLELKIPDGAKVYADEAWDGTIVPPEDVTNTANIPGYFIGSAVQVGSYGLSLVFDQPVRLDLPSMLGKVFYSIDGNTWTEITTQCNDILGDGISFPNECYYVNGDSTVIWTYHLSLYGDGSPESANAAVTEATVTIEPGVRVIGVTDSLGNVIEEPTVALPEMTSGFANYYAEVTLGTPDQQILMYNPTSTDTWSVTLSATDGPTAQWVDSINGYTMDFNDATGAGQLTLDPTAGTISLAQVNPANGLITGLSQSGEDIDGLTLGSLSSFDQGASDSITLFTSTSADPYRIYSLQDLGLKQMVPAMQPAGTYELNITITSS